MTIKNFTFFSPNGTEFPVGSNNDGKLYSGYIADRVKTEFSDRLIFVESGDKPNVV